MAFTARSGITLSATWELSGSLDVDRWQVDPNTGGQGYAEWRISFGPLTAHGAAALNGNTPDDPDLSGIWTVHLTNDRTSSVDDGGYGRLSLDLGGTVSMSMPCALCWEYATPPVRDDTTTPYFGDYFDIPLYCKRRYFLVQTGEATGSASWAGVSLALSDSGNIGNEVSPECLVTIASLVGAAGVYPITGHFGGVNNGSGSLTIALSDEMVPEPDGSVSSSSKTVTITTSRDTDSDGIPDDSISLTGNATASAGGGGVSGTASNTGVASATHHWHPARSYIVSGTVQAMEAVYPDDLDFSDQVGAFTASGEFSRSGTQHRYDLSTSATAGIGDSLSTDSHSVNIDTFADIHIDLDPASVIANGDDNDTAPVVHRMLLRPSKSVPVISFAQAASLTIDDMVDGDHGTGDPGDPVVTMATEASGTGCTAVATGGEMVITTDATHAGSGRRTYSPPYNLGGMSYIAFDLTSVGAANVPVTITIQTSVWHTTTGADGEMVTRKFRLDTPDVVSSDGWDSRWTPDGDQWSSMNGPGIGVDSIHVGIPHASEVHVGAIRLLSGVDNDAKMDFVPTLFKASPVYLEDSLWHIDPEWPITPEPEKEFGDSGTSQFYVRRFVLGNSDGRQTVEEWDFGYTQIIPNESGVNDSVAPAVRTVQDLADVINFGLDTNGARLWLGWSASVLVAAPTDTFDETYSGEPPPEDDYFYNAGLPSNLLMGAGALFGFSAETGELIWDYGWDVGLSGVPVQDLFDYVELCGLMSDDEHTFGAAIILRSGGHGRTINSAGAVAPDIVVAMLQAAVDPVHAVSTGLSRAGDGWYHMSSPPMAKPPDGDITAVRSGQTTPVVPMAGPWLRHRSRAILVVNYPFTPKVLAIDSPRSLLQVANGKVIHSFHLANMAQNTISVEHPIDAWESLTHDPRRGALFGVAVVGTDRKIYRSDDLGLTISEVSSMAANSSQIARDSERGYLIAIWEDQSNGTDLSDSADIGTLQWQYSADGGATWSTATPALLYPGATSITARVLSLAQDGRAAGVLCMVAVDNAGVSNVLQSSDCGATWQIALAGVGS